MAKFITIGERLSTTAPAVNKAFLSQRERSGFLYYLFKCGDKV